MSMTDRRTERQISTLKTLIKSVQARSNWETVSKMSGTPVRTLQSWLEE